MSDNLNPWTNLAPVENANAKISNYPAKEGEWQVAHLNTLDRVQPMKIVLIKWVLKNCFTETRPDFLNCEGI
jgi:hypothetical protein